MNTSVESVRTGNILIVDDTPDNVRLLSSMLTNEGYEVRKALNGPRALVTVQQSLPDLILLDVMMPEMDGYEICEQLKAEESTRSIPIIFVSALDDVFDKVKAFELGAVDYITKPFHSQEVLARVATHLLLRKQQRKLQEQTQELKIKNELLKTEIRQRERTEVELRLARLKSDRLLLNIFPKEIVTRLKNCEGTVAEHFEEATILFADMVNFTPVCAAITPLELVSWLNQIFSQFDRLTEKYGLEKIKTIGDAYMVAGGLPIPKQDSTEAIAEMALQMQQAIENFKIAGTEPFQLRIGIHTGPVVAGVIGTKKFSYDLWGDTVNVASRMESLGMPGKIQVTAETYKRLKDRYILTPRGAIAVKGKGEMMTYWLEGRQ